MRGGRSGTGRVGRAPAAVELTATVAPQGERRDPIVVDAVHADAARDADEAAPSAAAGFLPRPLRGAFCLSTASGGAARPSSESVDWASISAAISLPLFGFRRKGSTPATCGRSAIERRGATQGATQATQAGLGRGDPTQTQTQAATQGPTKTLFLYCWPRAAPSRVGVRGSYLCKRG